MKRIIDKVGADIDTVSVDSFEVRERLLEDDKFGIDQVPSVLVLYSSGRHKTYTRQPLDEWFSQLLKNIEQFKMQQQPAEGFPTHGRHGPGSTSEIHGGHVTNLIDVPPVQGGGINGSGMTGGTQIPGVGGISSAQAAMVSEHIRDAEPVAPISSASLPVPAPNGVKTPGLSAAELAKQIADQREQYDDKLEENRPY